MSFKVDSKLQIYLYLWKYLTIIYQLNVLFLGYLSFIIASSAFKSLYMLFVIA